MSYQYSYLIKSFKDLCPRIPPNCLHCPHCKINFKPNNIFFRSVNKYKDGRMGWVKATFLGRTPTRGFRIKVVDPLYLNLWGNRTYPVTFEQIGIAEDPNDIEFYKNYK